MDNQKIWTHDVQTIEGIDFRVNLIGPRATLSAPCLTGSRLKILFPLASANYGC
jgi:hypothetical protein